MSDYTPTYDFSAKDALSTGDGNKLIKGTEVDIETAAIQTAIATKANLAVPAATNNIALLSAAGNLVDSTITTAEASILDGATVTTAELNILDGVTSTAAELNILDGVTSTAAELNLLDGATLKQKVVDIGDWNMTVASGSLTLSVAHGLTLANIRSISALIRNDTDASYSDLVWHDTTATSGNSAIYADGTNIKMEASAGGHFDNVGYNSTSYNRGWITIWYV